MLNTSSDKAFVSHREEFTFHSNTEKRSYFFAHRKTITWNSLQVYSSKHLYFRVCRYTYIGAIRTAVVSRRTAARLPIINKLIAASVEARLSRVNQDTPSR